MDKLAALESFVQVAEQASFSRAARQLGRSKATISKQVAELEATLGAQLLLRTTRKVRLTDIGQAYLARSRQLLSDLGDMEAEAQRSEAALHGVLRVAGPTTFADLYLAPALHAFMQQHPDLEIELTLTDEVVDLLSYPFDLAIRISQLEDSSLIARRLASSSVICCAAPAYLEHHGTPPAPQALAGHQLILDSNFRNPAVWRFRHRGAVQNVRVRGRLQVNSALVVRQLVLAGAGVALIPAFVVQDAIADGRLLVLPFECEAHDLGVYAVYPQRRHLTRRVRVFVDFLAAWFRDGLQPVAAGRPRRRRRHSSKA